MAKIKRSSVQSLLNTGTPSVPVWSLISSGVPAGTINMNPKVLEETYIGDDNATISVESYAPNMAIESTAINGDDVFEWLDANRIGRDVLDDVETEIVNVWLYETSSAGYYWAEKQDVSVQCDSFGGDGGTAVKLNYTINYLGEPVLGSYSPTEEEFVDSPLYAMLTSLEIGELTLSPTFDEDWLWYTASTSNASDTITVEADDEEADITIDVDDTPVENGASASWGEGENEVTIEVETDEETVEYKVYVTYTPS